MQEPKEVRRTASEKRLVQDHQGKKGKIINREYDGLVSFSRLIKAKYSVQRVSHSILLKLKIKNSHYL